MHPESERDRRSVARRDPSGTEPQPEAGGLLRDMIRRVVGPREPAVYVMEPDGKLRRGRE